MTKLCRWGFLSAANIARKNWLAIKNSGNGVVTAVASRDAPKSQAFIDECQSTQPFETSPNAFEGYDALVESPDVDAVYIPLPTALRRDWVIKAAEHGKHVLCEKPCATSATELKTMIDACDANGVQFMDGVMFMHTKRYREMRAALDVPTNVGDIRRIASQFSFNGGDDFESSNIRLSSELEPYGALGDLGWYCIRFTLWAMNYEMPLRVTGNFINVSKRDDSLNAVPVEISGEMFFDNGVSATFYNSFITQLQQWGHISGSLGQMTVPNFVLPAQGSRSKYSIANPENVNVGCEFKINNHERDEWVSEASDSADDAPETELVRKFASIVLSGDLEPIWPEISMKTQQVMDAVMQSAQNDGRPCNVIQ